MKKKEMLLQMKQAIETINNNKLRYYDGIETLPYKSIREGYYWVMKVLEQEHKVLQQVWNSQPHEIWDRYELTGMFNDCREVILLKEAKKALGRAIHERPNAYRKWAIKAHLKSIRLASEGKTTGTDVQRDECDASKSPEQDS